MARRQADPSPALTLDHGFRSWCDAREPALQRLAALLTADDVVGRDLLREVLPRMDADWSRIGAVAADDTARARLLEAYRRRRWTDGAAQPPPTSPAADVDLLTAAWARVSELPAQVRAATVLVRHEGLDDAEAGRLIGLSAEGVRLADSEAVAALAAVVQEVRRRDPTRPAANADRLLTEALTERAEAAAYTPVPRDEIEATAASLRRRRRLALVGGGAALVVLAVAVAAALGNPPERPPPTAEVSSLDRAPYGPLGRYERTGLPEVPYLIENVLHDPDGTRVELPMDRPRAAVRLGDEVFVAESTSEGDLLHRVDATGHVLDTVPTVGDPVLRADGSALAWLERRRADRLILHFGGKTQRIDRTAHVVGVSGEHVVLDVSGGVWVTDLRAAPRPLGALRGAISVSANGLVAGVSVEGQEVVVVDLLGRVQWSSSNWLPGRLSPDGRYLAAVGATRTRLVNAVLDARTGALVREIDWANPAPGVLDVRWESPETVLALAVDQGESAILRISVADGEVSRATPPMSGDMIGMSRYRFASR